MKESKFSWYICLTYFLFIVFMNFDQALAMEAQEQQKSPTRKRVLYRAQSDPGTLQQNLSEREEKNSEIPNLKLNPIYGCSQLDLTHNSSKKENSPRRKRNAGHELPPLPRGLPSSPRTNSIPSQPGPPKGRPRSSSSPRGTNMSKLLIEKSAPLVLGSPPRGLEFPRFKLEPSEQEPPKPMSPPTSHKGFYIYELHEWGSLGKHPKSIIKRSQSNPELGKKKGVLANPTESNPAQRKKRGRTESVHNGSRVKLEN